MIHTSQQAGHNQKENMNRARLEIRYILDRLIGVISANANLEVIERLYKGTTTSLYVVRYIIDKNVYQRFLVIWYRDNRHYLICYQRYSDAINFFNIRENKND